MSDDESATILRVGEWSSDRNGFLLDGGDVPGWLRQQRGLPVCV
jgi:hypothetical protein